MSGRRSVTRLVLATELRQLLRDRRALFAAVVLPALLYPLLFWAMEAIEESSREMLEAREILVAVDLSRADADVADRARSSILQRTPITVVDVDAADLVAFEEGEAPGQEDEAARARRRAELRGLLAGGGEALLTAVPHPLVASRTLFRIYYEVKDDDAREAVDRVQVALEEVEDQLVPQRRAALLATDPAAGLDLDAVDVARAEDASGARLGGLLPLIAVLVLLSGGSYAALAVFAGEREARTLETLLVQPVPTTAVVNGKYLAVLTAGLATLFANLASILLSVAVGLASDLTGGVEGGLDPLRLAGGLVVLPACLLLCAILCLFCGRARTFRQGQLTIFPILIVAALPTAVALQPQVELSLLLAAVPFTGPALAMRDVLRGELALLPTVVMVVSHLGWTWLALSRLGSVLDAERVLSTADTDAEGALRHASSRHGLRWGFFAVLTIYVVGGDLQRRSLPWGLFLTLWVVLPLLALACSIRARRRGGGALASEWRLRAPRAAHLIGALLLAPGAVFVIREWVLPLELRFLPLPSSAAGAGELVATLTGMSTPLLLFLVAVSPGIWEEVFFRGAMLSSLARDLRPTRAVLWQALFFAAAHASIHRLVPTGLLGIAFGVLTLRARSLWPAVVLHVGYDAFAVLGELGRLPAADHDAWGWAPWLALPGAALCALPRKRHGT